MSLEITHFKSDGETVTMVGSGATWDGYQAEIEFFFFHAERFARFAGTGEEAPTVAYQADDNIYGFRRLGTGYHGVFAARDESGPAIALREVIEDLC